MAGYIMNLDSIESLKLYVKNGVYATKLNIPTNGHWGRNHEGTFADYATMKTDDNIYFFINRKIFGIGQLIEIDGDCKFFNFPKAPNPENYDYQTIKNQLLWDEGEFSVGQRCLCIFKPSPYFFKNGIDMDDVLASNPGSFKILRAFWKVSFIKIDDDENQALIDIVLRSNKNILETKQTEYIFETNHASFHKKLSKQITSDYFFSSKKILKNCASGDYIRHEMAIETGILEQISKKESNAIETFSKWDYLSHQVIASPFKHIDYMDRMDIFGYSYIQGFDKTKSKFLLIEIKKDDASCEDIDQIMKYVDWVKDEYSFGDYSMIEAFLVAYDFSTDIIEHSNEVAKRTYVVGRRPARSATWKQLTLVKYRFEPNKSILKFYKYTQ